MSELVCVTSGCKEGGVGIETRGARRIAFCAKSCDLWTGASASTSRADAAAAAATSQLRESSAFEKLRLPVGLASQACVEIVDGVEVDAPIQHDRAVKF